MTAPPPSVSRATLRAAARYRQRIARGERILRDAAGHMHWAATGRPAAQRTVRFMLDHAQIFELDTDLFGDRAFGQTIGEKEAVHA